jgi:hypothetical protein
LKTTFAFLRTFEANAPGIFRKFERFAKGLIDAANARFSVRFLRSMPGQPDVFPAPETVRSP